MRKNVYESKFVKKKLNALQICLQEAFQLPVCEVKKS